MDSRTVPLYELKDQRIPVSLTNWKNIVAGDDAQSEHYINTLHYNPLHGNYYSNTATNTAALRRLFGRSKASAEPPLAPIDSSFPRENPIMVEMIKYFNVDIGKKGKKKRKDEADSGPKRVIMSKMDSPIEPFIWQISSQTWFSSDVIGLHFKMLLMCHCLYSIVTACRTFASSHTIEPIVRHLNAATVVAVKAQGVPINIAHTTDTQLPWIIRSDVIGLLQDFISGFRYWSLYCSNLHTYFENSVNSKKFSCKNYLDMGGQARTASHIFVGVDANTRLLAEDAARELTPLIALISHIREVSTASYHALACYAFDIMCREPYPPSGPVPTVDALALKAFNFQCASKMLADGRMKEQILSDLSVFSITPQQAVERGRALSAEIQETLIPLQDKEVRSLNYDEVLSDDPTMTPHFELKLKTIKLAYTDSSLDKKKKKKNGKK